MNQFIPLLIWGLFIVGFVWLTYPGRPTLKHHLYGTQLWRLWQKVSMVPHRIRQVRNRLTATFRIKVALEVDNCRDFKGLVSTSYRRKVFIVQERRGLFWFDRARCFTADNAEQQVKVMVNEERDLATDEKPGTIYSYTKLYRP